ncbi:MAG: prolyl aminopeptidase [Burkholderiaceae bacterium]
MDNIPVHAWQAMHPPIACHANALLDVGDGHAIHWEECGHPLGIPVLFVHGGPGAGCNADDRRWFDPARCRIVLFDQRGAGRSWPAGSLVENTTAHLLRDIETLRRHRQIERWQVFGGSWGATLALAYAQAHPERVAGLVLRGIFTATARERRWLYGRDGAARSHPQAWARLLAALPACADRDLLGACAHALHSGDPAIEATAARAWLDWELALMDDDSSASDHSTPPHTDPGALLASARIGVHYARHGWFLDEGQLLRDAGRLRGVPGVMVQGLRDAVTPPQAAIELQRAWPGSTLLAVTGAGHSSRHPAVARHLVDATARWQRDRRLPSTDLPIPR